MQSCKKVVKSAEKFIRFPILPCAKVPQSVCESQVKKEIPSPTCTPGDTPKGTQNDMIEESPSALAKDEPLVIPEIPEMCVSQSYEEKKVHPEAPEKSFEKTRKLEPSHKKGTRERPKTSPTFLTWIFSPIAYLVACMLSRRDALGK